MAIRAVVFDIGGVLEITPRTGWNGRWEADLHLAPGEIESRLADAWRGGSIIDRIVLENLVVAFALSLFGRECGHACE